MEGQRADTLGRNLIEIRNVIANQTQEDAGNSAKNETMGVVESQNEIGANARNLGLKLRTEMAKGEHVHASIALSLATVKEMGPARVQIAKECWVCRGCIRIKSFSNGRSTVCGILSHGRKFRWALIIRLLIMGNYVRSRGRRFR